MPNPPEQVAGEVISVGGSPEPIKHSLSRYRPTYVLFVVSEESRGQIEEKILPGLDYTPQYSYAVVSSPEDISSCYRELRSKIREWLEEKRLQPDTVVVDITGGTKPMSAALALAAVEQFHHFAYVGGAQRDKGGLGVVVSGTEQIVPTTNPWDELAVRELELARHFYARHQVAAAAEILRRAAGKARRRQEELETLADLCQLLAQADDFQFRNLFREFKRRQLALGVIFKNGRRPVFDQLQRLAEHWQQLEEESQQVASGGRPGLVARRTLLELIANAERRAAQGRFDDAAARLYRAVELAAQNRLAEAFGARLGRLMLEQIPEPHREAFAREFAHCRDEEGFYQLALRRAFEALRYSPRSEDQKFSEVYPRLHNVLQYRNQSILAHGLVPITEHLFHDFYKTLLAELDIHADSIPRWPAGLLDLD